MKKAGIFIFLTLLLVACGGRSRQAELEQKIDSLRKVELARQLQAQGISTDPVEAFFDTLSIRPLPMLYSETFLTTLPGMQALPHIFYQMFGVNAESDVRIASLPSVHGHRALLVAEKQDSANVSLYIFTMDRMLNSIDQMCIYERAEVERGDDYGDEFIQYFITSDFEVTLLYYFQNHDAQVPRLEQSRRYIIDADGKFEETIIEL